MKMDKRCSLSLLLLVVTALSIHAQWTEKDSLYLQDLLSGEGELKLNEEATKLILLEAPSLSGSLQEPLRMDNQREILDFDTTLPDFFAGSDSLSHRIYLSLRPYGAFSSKATLTHDLPMVVPSKYRLGYTRRWKGISPALLPEGIGKRVHAPIGPSASIAFSAEDLLQYLFSKKGRARMRNARNANAWKTY